MEHLLAKLSALEEKEQTLSDEREKVQREMEDVTKAIRSLEIEAMTEDYKEFLVKRLTLLKAYVETARDVSRFVQVAYKIEKMKSPRQNDYHEDEPDYLPWTIHDNECLAMHYYVDVIIEIYSPAVEEFVVDWITKNMPFMEKNMLFGRYS